jgi:hypothetical protein
MRTTPRSLAAASIAALTLLAACSQEPETIEGGPADPDAANVAAAAPVELPPAITASKTYRCKDNSLVYVDFFNNNTAAFRTEKGGTPTMLTAAEAGKPFTGEGHSIASSDNQTTISYPGHASQSCKA